MYSELAFITRKATTITCVWQRLLEAVGKLCSEKKEPPVIPVYGLIGGWGHGEAIGRLSRSKASYVIGFGENIWLLLVGPELEAGTANREAYNNWPDPDFWRLAATKFWGQSSIGHVRLHIQSFSPLFSSLFCLWVLDQFRKGQKSRPSPASPCQVYCKIFLTFCCIIRTVICSLWQKWEQLIVSISCFRSRDTNCSTQVKRTNSTGHED